MRDIAVFIGFAAMLPFAFGRPFIGVLLWAWTALLVPNAYVYSFAAAIPYNMVVAIITLVMLGVSSEPVVFKMNRTVGLLLLFFAWATVSTIFTIGNPEHTWELWTRFAKIIVFAIVIGLVIRRELRFDALVYAIVLSLGFHGFVEGLKFIASGGGHRIVGPGSSIIADNNQFALAMLCTVPLALYLYKRTQHRILKAGLLSVAGLLFFTVVGTFSRGGFIGIAALTIWAFIHSKKKFRFVAIVVPFLAVVAAFAPSTWFERMDTIGSANKDSSFMGRVIAWKQSTLIALDHPVFGGGFHSVQTYNVWTYYKENRFSSLSFIPTEEPDAGSGHAAHSIYFEVLGDLGFGGLLIFGALAITTLGNARAIIRQTADKPHLQWAGELARAIEYALVAYYISGAALSMGYFELIYVFMAMLANLRQVVEADSEKKVAHV